MVFINDIWILNTIFFVNFIFDCTVGFSYLIAFKTAFSKLEFRIKNLIRAS